MSIPKERVTAMNLEDWIAQARTQELITKGKDYLIYPIENFDVAPISDLVSGDLFFKDSLARIAPAQTLGITNFRFSTVMYKDTFYYEVDGIAVIEKKYLCHSLNIG